MDTKLRNLLQAAQNPGAKQAGAALQSAYDLLRNVAETRPAVDMPESFSQDLYVVCAEVAFQHGKQDMAKECLKMYFMKTPPTNQFLCRAYLCQAQLLAPTSAENPEQLEKAVVYLLKSINMSKENARYHFLVYNASVLYWQFCRPFLKPNYRQYLARSLHQVVKALDDIDDKDYEWRAQLMISLIECHMDAGRRSDASHIATAAVSFIKQHVPTLYKTVFGLMVRHQLVDTNKFSKDIKASPELNMYYQICRLKLAIEQKDPDKDIHEDMRRIVSNIAGQDLTKGNKSGRGSPDERPASSASRLSHTDSARSYSRQGSRSQLQLAAAGSGTERKPGKGQQARTASSPLSGRRASGFDTLKPISRSQSMRPPSSGPRSPTRLHPRSPTPSAALFKALPPDSPEKPYLLLELGRLALEQNLPDIAQACVDHIKECSHLVKDASFFLEVEFMNAELMVRSLGDKQESYQRNMVETRIQAIKRCDEAILNAVRLNNPNVIQAGCVTQWNLCLPLLQPNLRNHVRRPLATVAESLEAIQSLLMTLRCQTHMELAKCEEDQEQIEVAMNHLKKALSLDDGGVYRERLEVALHRLEVRAELYAQPERAEDQAAMIIEQARKAATGTMRMKRSLLVRAGQALAPEAFVLVLESESDTKEVTSGKGPLTQIKKLAGRAHQFTKSVKKAAGHLRRLGDDNDRERARLWADLAKTARKQEVWDVCRVAARFCLLYDDGRWKNMPPSEPDELKIPEPAPAEPEAAAALAREKSSMSKTSKEASRPATPEPQVPLHVKDLIRTMAEVHFINGEAMIHLLRTEGVELGELPNPPEDKSKHPKGYIPTKSEDDPDWIQYCEWIKTLSEDGVTSFLRAIELGVELDEAWIVCSSAAYIWNYNNHTLRKKDFRKIVDPLQTILDGLKQVGHASETSLLVNICNALAKGLMQPWLPPPVPRDMVAPSPPPGFKGAPAAGSKSPSHGSAKKGGKGATPAAAAAKPKGPVAITISPDAGPDLKKAVEVCEYAIKVTNGERPLDVVSIGIRHPLLQTWVQAKQMLQSQVSRGFGTEDEASQDGQDPLTRAMVVVEMLSVNNNGIMEFRESPPLTQAVEMVEGCKWPDSLIELQMWTKLTFLGFEAKDHNIVVQCANKALAFAESGTQPKGKKIDQHKFVVEQEMLSYTSAIFGQSLVENAQGKNMIRRQAMQQFLNSARFGANSQNCDLVMTAARHYWNAALTLINQPIERELLREPLVLLLECMANTMDKKKYKKEESGEEGGSTDSLMKAGTGGGGIAPVDPTAEAGGNTDANKPPGGIIGGPDDDLTLRAALYGVLFQCYADKGEWEAGLKAMDLAIRDMPRTNHRLLIFKHMVMVRAKLGLNVQMSIQKFKDESEDYVAHMWRRVALCSKEQVEQLQAYQNAIEALSSAASDWQKFDYLLEFGQWLYCNEFPLVNAINQIEWAADILLNMKFEAEQKKDVQDGFRFDMNNGGDTERDPDIERGKAKGKKGKGGKKESTVEPPPSSPARPPKKGAGKGAAATESKKHISADAPKKQESAKASDADGDKASEINAADYIPVKKDIVIGLEPSNTSLQVSDLTDIRQLEGLFRSHVLMAQMSGRCAQNYADYCFMAYSYIVRMWQVSLSRVGPVLKELAKNPPPVEATSGKNSAKGAKGKGKNEKEPPPKEKPKRKGPIDAVPQTSEEWAAYDAPDEVLDAFKHDLMKSHGINKHTITKPALTLFYLDQLVSHLRDLGYNHLALPILVMAEIIARDILKSRSVIALVHLKTMEVCLELNLVNSASFHEKLADYTINEDEQARSREEMVMMNERQVQVLKEERRLRESMTEMLQEMKGSRAQITPQPLKKEEDDVTTSHLGKQIGSVHMREVWTDTAEILIRHALYQPAREMLNEAYKAAQAFKDNWLMARILFLFGRLSFCEAQYGQAVNFCTQAQKTFDGDEMFWFETTMLMVKATEQDYTIKNRYKQARSIVFHALSVFGEIAEMRPNKMSITGYIMASFAAKLGSLEGIIAFADVGNVSKPKIISALLTACKKLHKAEGELVKLGHEREAILVYKEHADILTRLARDAGTPSEKHNFYMQALNVYQTACHIGDLLLHSIQTSSSIQDMNGISCPLQREVSELRLVTVDNMLEMLELYVQEERQRQQQEQRKGSTLRAVEELIQESPEYSDAEKDWINTTSTLAERTLTLLTASHSLVGPIPALKCRVMYNTGRCFRLLSILSNPDPQHLWDLHEMNMLSMAQKVQSPQHRGAPPPAEGDEEEEEEEEEDEMDDITDRQRQRYQQMMAKMKAKVETCHIYLSQATECLSQSINLALHHHIMKYASLASLEMVECLGQYDPGLSSQYLALYQSCRASEYMEDLMAKALVDPTLSQAAALMQQKRNVQDNDLCNNGTHGLVMRTVNSTLNDGSWQMATLDLEDPLAPNRIATEAWKRLSVTSQHLELLKEFPPNFNFVVLQHSPDKSYLYGAVLDKPKPGAGAHGGGGGKGQKGNLLQAVSKARIVRVETSGGDLKELQARFKWFKQEVMQVLLKQEYQRSQAAQREKMLANLEDNLKKGLGHVVESEHLEDEQNLHEEFISLLKSLEEYLKPITSLLETSLRPASATTISNERRVDKEPATAQEYVVLLADPDLLELPLEALSALQSETIVSLSREVSLQMMYHKIHVEATEESVDKIKKDREKFKPPSRIPGLRDASKKQAKIIPLDRPVPNGCLPVDTHAFRYIVDPHQDCAETEEKAPAETFNKLLEEYETQFTPRWLGVAGNEHTPSPGEYEIYIRESSAFVFYGMERFLCYLPPHKVAALNLSECELVMLYDLQQTNKSFLRQSKVDVLKTAEVLSLEKPVETAVLLGLTGVKTVCLNQWHCTLAENAEKLEITMKDMLSKGLTTGQTMRLLATPYRRKDEEADADAAGADGNNNDKVSVKGSEAPKSDSASQKDERSESRRSSQKSQDGTVVEAPAAPADPIPNRTWFNMVCYGLPNVLVTQVSKV